MNKPRVDGSTNIELTIENNLKAISHPVEFVDDIFTVYKKKMVGFKRHLLFAPLRNL